MENFPGKTLSHGKKNFNSWKSFTENFWVTEIFESQKTESWKYIMENFESWKTFTENFESQIGNLHINGNLMAGLFDVNRSKDGTFSQFVLKFFTSWGWHKSRSFNDFIQGFQICTNSNFSPCFWQ